jgi:hypothetical protein
MVATDQRLVGRCAIEEGHARLCCLWHVQVEPERPFRMQEADRRVDHGVAGEEHFFAAGTDMHRHVAWRVTGGVEGGHARRHLRSGLDQAQPGPGQSQIRLGNQRLLVGGHFAGQLGGAPEGNLGLAGDEFGRGEQQRRVLVVTDTPQVVEVGVSEQDHVDIARRVARGGEVAKQPAGRFLELIDAAARVDQHQLVARVDEDGVDLQSHRARRLERGCEQASCVHGAVAPQRFGGERERSVAYNGDLDGAELEAVEARLRLLALLGCTGEGRGFGGPDGDGSGAGTQECPAIEHEHVCSPLRLALVTLNTGVLVTFRVRRVRSGCLSW